MATDTLLLKEVRVKGVDRAIKTSLFNELLNAFDHLYGVALEVDRNTGYMHPELWMALERVRRSAWAVELNGEGTDGR